MKTDEEPSSSNEGRGDKYDSSKGTEDMQWDKISERSPIKRPDPHWLENINLTSDLIYKYQLGTRALSDVLKDDMIALKNFQQVNIEIKLIDCNVNNN